MTHQSRQFSLRSIGRGLLHTAPSERRTRAITLAEWAQSARPDAPRAGNDSASARIGRRDTPPSR